MQSCLVSIDSIIVWQCMTIEEHIILRTLDSTDEKS